MKTNKLDTLNDVLHPGGTSSHQLQDSMDEDYSTSVNILTGAFDSSLQKQTLLSDKINKMIAEAATPGNGTAAAAGITTKKTTASQNKFDVKPASATVTGAGLVNPRGPGGAGYTNHSNER
jgi:hypothetical protein